MMNRLRTPLVLTVVALIAAPAASQSPVMRTALDAWDRGDYPDALRGFEQVLTSADGTGMLREIALVTGEWFRTSEIAPDGTAPRWSPDGTRVAFETPSAGVDGTRVMELTAAGPSLLAQLPGTGAVFAPDGRRIAYLQVEDGAERQRAIADARSGPPPRNRNEFRQLAARLARIDAGFTRVRIWERGANTRTLSTGGLAVFEVAYGTDGTLYLLAAAGDAAGTDVYAMHGDSSPVRITTSTGTKSGLTVLPGSAYLMFTTPRGFALHSLARGVERPIEGRALAVSADGSTVAFLREENGQPALMVMPVDGEARRVFTSNGQLDNPALSPGGDRVVVQSMDRENWELLVIDVAQGEVQSLTHDVQHDLFPRFLDDNTILAVKGEGRHRRSYLYDVATGVETRFFHNNTIRTVAPEYKWVASPDGSRVLIVSERDGDTISPERGLYVVDRRRTVTRDDVRQRIRASLAAEVDLRRRGELQFAPIADAVRAAVGDVTTGHIYGYERDLFAFGTKFIGTPGNARAIDYLTETLRSFGYEPVLQWFEPRPGIQSANIVATLRGTVDPDVTYVLSSHFDSVNRGPGADDNTSGTAALLEAARVLADRPQPRTIEFAFFTGEEAGLLGSREFVRRAVAAGEQIVGALNNDMVGYANDNRLDDTIRYSNAGIRDVQHAAAFLFTDLITYDAKYYKSTDAHAYYDAYGDIVGGIGSYPILANPHYHQSHDVLETINHQLVAEVSKTTVATLQLLTASPSRVTDLTVARRNGQLVARWTPSVESDVVRYVVTAGIPGDPERHTVTVTSATATLPDPGPDAVVTVTAVNAGGMRSWDRAVQAIAP